MDKSPVNAKDSANMYMRSFEQEDHLIENPLLKPHPQHRSKRKVSFRRSKMRYLGLFFQCFILVGQKYCFDNPQALQSALTSPEFLGLSSAQYNLLYSSYSFPNMVVPFVGGLIIDKLSIRVALFLFSTTVIVGQIVVLIGGSLMNFTCMIVGRFLFGLGGECLAVTQTSSIAKWFKSRELALALALALGCNRMGSLLNSCLTPYLFSSTQSLVWPLAIGLIVTLYSWLCGLALNYMDKESDKREGQIVEVDEEDEDEKVDYKINCKVFSEFKGIYWLIILALAFCYGSFLTFTGNANDLYSKIFSITNQTAGFYITLIYLSSGLFLPFVGCFIDAFGKRPLILCFSIICFFTVHILLISFNGDIEKSMLIIPVILCGVFYACFGGFIWNAIALVVREDQLGMAYGGGYAFMNIVLVVNPLFYGMIHDSTLDVDHGYFWAELFLALQNVFCFCVSIIILIMDLRGDNKLMKRVEKKDAYRSLQKKASQSFMSFG